jgi:uncharacterized protein (UPF0333 family)
MRTPRGQAAFEYLVIISLILVFLTPIWAYVTSMQQQTNVELMLTYAKNAANQIADASNLVYSQGPPAKVRINIYIPYSVENVTIVNNSIDFRVRVNSEVTDIFAFSNAQLNGSIPREQGYYWVNIEAKDNIVQIERELSS